MEYDEIGLMSPKKTKKVKVKIVKKGKGKLPDSKPF